MIRNGLEGDAIANRLSGNTVSATKYQLKMLTHTLLSLQVSVDLVLTVEYNLSRVRSDHAQAPFTMTTSLVGPLRDDERNASTLRLVEEIFEAGIILPVRNHLTEEIIEEFRSLQVSTGPQPILNAGKFVFNFHVSRQMLILFHQLPQLPDRNLGLYPRPLTPPLRMWSTRPQQIRPGRILRPVRRRHRLP